MRLSSLQLTWVLICSCLEYDFFRLIARYLNISLGEITFAEQQGLTETEWEQFFHFLVSALTQRQGWLYKWTTRGMQSVEFQPLRWQIVTGCLSQSSSIGLEKNIILGVFPCCDDKIFFQNYEFWDREKIFKHLSQSKLYRKFQCFRCCQ